MDSSGKKRPGEGLDPDQRAAALAGDGTWLVLAGAGSGKTLTFAHRVAHLLLERGMPAFRVMALTFTNKAAREMRSRVESLVGPDLARELVAGTFHSVCARLLRRHAGRLGRTGHFVIYDQEDQKSLLERVLADMGMADASPPVEAVAGFLSRAKERMADPGEVSPPPGLPSGIAVEVLRRYEERLVASNAFDFGDLVAGMARLLLQDEEVRSLVAGRFLHVLVDEYQDTSRAQAVLLQGLTSVHGNLWVVGDDDQSIYGWRGAEVRNMLDFTRTFPGAQVLRLQRNYRSTASILEAADAVIARSPERLGKVLVPVREEGCRVEVLDAPDPRAEARLVVEAIRRHLAEGGRPGDVAILYRTNAQSRPFEEALLRDGIPFEVVAGLAFYERAEVKDLMAYARLAVNPRDEVALRRVLNVPPRGIGPATRERIEAAAAGTDLAAGLERYAARALEEGGRGARTATAVAAFATLLRDIAARCPTMPPRQALSYLLDVTGLGEHLLAGTGPLADERVRNVEELLVAAAELEAVDPTADLCGFLGNLALASDADARRGGERVALMTVHAAKGLEFPIVFVTGLEDGLFPLRRGGGAGEDESEGEERRLAYVAFTRARDRLVLTHARQRRRWWTDESREMTPSRFLAELPADVVACRYATEPSPVYPLPTPFPPARFPDPLRAAAVPSRRVRRPTWWPAEPEGPGEHPMATFPSAPLHRFSPSPSLSPCQGSDGYLAGEEGSCPTHPFSDDAPALAPSPGQTVEHAAFGKGVVVSVVGWGPDPTVRVEFPLLGIRRVRLSSLRQAP